ncbi:MAG: hypothetical protein NC311_15125 [Muribaculaceae bacterium]|nr:hypothetical protein [Muribaculaceae bacterium]MCM1400351.1 hypothetical protein [Clostridium sp.]MCM1461052.1 hypothetical protein [Bacteroides sp.]
MTAKEDKQIDGITTELEEKSEPKQTMTYKTRKEQLAEDIKDFQEFHHVSDDEISFFEYLYKKERRYWVVIVILILVILVLALLLQR